MRSISLIFLIVSLLSGCSAQAPLHDLDVTTEYLREIDRFRVSPTNQYAIVMAGQIFKSTGSGVSNLQQLQSQEPIEEKFIEQDVVQITRLLTFKNYDTYQILFRWDSLDDFWKLLKKIKLVSDSETKVFITYSGEGDGVGLRTALLQITPSQTLGLSGTTITPNMLYLELQEMPGKFAILINACQSGIFVDEAPKDFRGVVLAACERGCVTTPYEPYGTTAIFGAFLELYAPPSQIHDLTQIELDIGDWWHNFLHKTFVTPKPGLKISYEEQVFRPSIKFLF